MRDRLPTEWNRHPWRQLRKTEFTIKLDGKTTTEITRKPVQSEWRENGLCLGTWLHIFTYCDTHHQDDWTRVTTVELPTDDRRLARFAEATVSKMLAFAEGLLCC
uniref:Uncharacterized protein n=1 Tax=Oryza meridionalis TaxID=40149 RepID=A0A0E0DQP3_9ORYZ